MSIWNNSIEDLLEALDFGSRQRRRNILDIQKDQSWYLVSDEIQSQYQYLSDLHDLPQGRHHGASTKETSLKGVQPL